MRNTEKHTHIMEKAEELFAAKGYDGTSIREIARAAHVNLAMVSYYFGSKEKLMEALFKERMSLMKLKIESLLKNENISPFQKVEILIDEYLTKVIDRQFFYKIMLCEMAQQKNKVILKFISDIKLNYANMIRGLVEEGQQKKVFKKDIDIMLLMNTMTGTVTQMILNKEVYREFNSLKKTSDSVYHTWLKKRLGDHIKKIFKTLLEYES
ncbi:MAG: TetR/AcrR family transcriptional regulator [Bacteroidetes bacterium]|nr:TetR/AcrR family transcriptional regulator [Bacteroidota bacterium]